MDEKEERIREIAYYLWRKEGSPPGQADRHWEEAKAIVEAEEAERKETEGEPPGGLGPTS